MEKETQKKLTKRLLKQYDGSSYFETEVPMGEDDIEDYYECFSNDEGNTVQNMSFEEYKEEGYYFFEVHSYINEERERVDEYAGMLRKGNVVQDLDDNFEKAEEWMIEEVDKKLIDKFRENFFDECENAKEEQAGRDDGYSVITLEEDGTIGRYIFHNNNEQHLNPKYTYLASIENWNIWDDEGFSSINNDGEEKEGYVWDNNENDWIEEDEAKQIIIDEACGGYAGQDIVFEEKWCEALDNIYFADAQGEFDENE